MQQLATSSSPSERVVAARRIENSSIWNRYFDYKELRSQDSKRTPFPRPQELDGNPESGHVGTDLHLQAVSHETALSAHNLDAELNELMLRHGTSQSAAEAIARTAFHIPASRQNVKHGQRFGAGAYFAEDIMKAYKYAQEEAGGLRFILLCRGVCGNMYYTEKPKDLDADVTAKRMGKHSALASPSNQGPREFIIQDASQVYPEYILDIVEFESVSL